ncbi:MAG: polysaccharide export protein [Rhodospirillales bacterium]|nr:polysaccharide export protein [Rhodospirillales bacterium]
MRDGKFPAYSRRRLVLQFIAAISILGGAAAALAQSPAANINQRPEETEPVAYTVGSGDRLRVIVFSEDDISGEFEVDGSGTLAMKLVGRINIKGFTLKQVEEEIAGKLREGYLRNPRVSVEVLNYRPFFILGEVEKRGSYPYVNGMTIANAVAIAGGYTYRAAKSRITIQRYNDPSKKEHPVNEDAPVLPGDIIRIPERFF